MGRRELRNTKASPREGEETFFFGRRPLPFGGSPLEAYSRTSGESNHHRQSVRVVENDALPTEPRGHLPREGEETAENPLPPHAMCHTPHWASAGRVAFYYFVFLKRWKCIRDHFLVVFGIRSGPSQGFSRIRKGIRRHPRVRWQICESKWLVFRTLPCDVAA